MHQHAGFAVQQGPTQKEEGDYLIETVFRHAARLQQQFAIMKLGQHGKSQLLVRLD